MGLYLILMGVQGAGKGVQAKFISETYSIPHVSTGDLFRAMKTRDDDLAKRVQAIMDAGKLVDDDTTNEIVVDRLAQPDAQNGVILDGYPRNRVQAEFLQAHLQEKGQSVSGLLLMKLDLYVAFKRAFGRFTDAETGDSYNIFYKNGGITVEVHKHPEGEYPPKVVATLDATGELLKRRSDDADALSVITRIDTYLQSTQPLIEYYQAQDLVFEVNADQSINNVSQDVKQIIDGLK